MMHGHTYIKLYAVCSVHYRLKDWNTQLLVFFFGGGWLLQGGFLLWNLKVTQHLQE